MIKTNYQQALKDFFIKLNLQEKKWKIIASDNTEHPFSNLDVIQSLNTSPDNAIKMILTTLEQQNGDVVKINNVLKQIAKSYCDNRIFLILALFEDYKKAKYYDQKDYFKNLINKFSENDLKEAGIYEQWKKITKPNNYWQLTPLMD